MLTAGMLPLRSPFSLRQTVSTVPFYGSSRTYIDVPIPKVLHVAPKYLRLWHPLFASSFVTADHTYYRHDGRRGAVN